MGFSLKSVRFIFAVNNLFTISFCTFSHWINGYFSRFFGCFKPFLGFSRLFYILYSACQITQPLVEFANQVSNTDNLIDMNAMAKLAAEENIPIGRNRLFKWLRKNGIIMSDNLPYQKYIERGYFSVKESVFETGSMTKTYQQTYVTGKGQAYIIGRLRKEFLQ